MSAAYPAPPVLLPATRLRPPSASSAETLVLIALLLQLVAAVALVGGILFLFGWAAFHPFAYMGVALTVAGVIGGLAVVFIYCAYTYSYQRIRQGDYAGAETPTLVLGILSIFLGLIPGILYLIGYSKLEDAIREQQPPAIYPGPMAPVLAQVACQGCGRVYFAGQFPFCPGCGRKLGP